MGYGGNVRQAGARAACTAVASAVMILVSATTASATQLIASIGGSGTIGGVTVANEDLLICNATSLGLGTTACTWQLLFDGSANGLNSKILAVDMLPNGTLVGRATSDDTLPDIGLVRAKDLVLFVPDDPLHVPSGPNDPKYASGEWRLYLNGNLVKDSSDSRVWKSVDVLADGTCEKNNPMNCDVVLSLVTGASLGGISFANEDLLACRPTAFGGGGSIEGCEYGMFLDASSINGGGTGSWTSSTGDVDIINWDPVTKTGTAIVSGGTASLPVAHQVDRDLFTYTGQFGGLCTDNSTRCIFNSDCPMGFTCGALPGGPSGTASFYFDGDTNGGLTGETLKAVGIFPDADGDGIQDGIDNCPNVNNPGQEDADNDGVGDVCDVDPDCPDPLNADTDGDGVGDPCDVCNSCFDPTNTDTDGDGQCDPCDYCPFRFGTTCFCGDNVVDPPSEECDLGGLNGQSGQPCSTGCQVQGACLGGASSGVDCTEDVDCPGGTCCGNAETTPPEECDDGNQIADDTCSNSCQFTPTGVPILGCEDVFGPNLVPAFVRVAKFTDTDNDNPHQYDKWKTKGDFNLGTGISVDPDTETVTLTFNQASILYQATLMPGAFTQSGSPTKPKWKFFDTEADVPGALGWRKAKLKLRLNKVKDLLDGRTIEIPISDTALGAPPIRLRQTLRIGDDCATAVLTCEKKASGKVLKCASVPIP